MILQCTNRLETVNSTIRRYLYEPPDTRQEKGSNLNLHASPSLWFKSGGVTRLASRKFSIVSQAAQNATVWLLEADKTQIYQHVAQCLIAYIFDCLYA